MMASSMAFSLSCVVLVSTVVSAPLVRAITCNELVSQLAPCLNYLRNEGAVSVPCCTGVRAMKAACNSKPACTQECKCLKGIATTIPDLNYGNATALPGKCGVTSPYPISPNTNCDKI